MILTLSKYIFCTCTPIRKETDINHTCDEPLLFSIAIYHIQLLPPH